MKLRSLTYGLLTLMTATTLLAQDADTAVWSIDLPDVVLTAQHRPTHYTEAMHHVELIDRDLLDERGVVQLQEALRTLSSVSITDDPILGTEVGMRTLGGNNIAILIDGAPLTGRLDGKLDISQIPVQNIERIEIIQGPLSVIYGNNAAGGVINVITKKLQRKSFEILSDHQYESIGILQNQLRIGFADKAFHGSIYGRIFDYDQYPIDSLRIFDRIEQDNGTFLTLNRYPWNPKQQYSGGTYLAYQLSQDDLISVNAEHTFEELQDYGVLRRPQFNPYSDDQVFQNRRTRVSLNYEGQSGNEIYWEGVLSYNDLHRVRSYNRFFHETQEIQPELLPSDSSVFRQWFGRLVASRQLSDKSKLMMGLTSSIETARGDNILSEERKDSSVAQISEHAVFVDFRHEFADRLEFSAAGRYALHSANTNRLTPSLMMRYRLSPKWQARATIAQGYRTPSLKELYLEFIDINHFVVGNQALRPELSADYQLTFDFDNRQDTRLSFNAYHTRIQDQIILVEFENLKFQYRNIDEYRVTGAQVQWQQDLKNWSFIHSSNFSLWKADLPFTVEDELNSSFNLNQNIAYTWDNLGLNANVNYRFTAAQNNFLFENGEVVNTILDPIHLLDIGLNKTLWNDKIQLSAGVKNLADFQLANVQNTSVVGNHVMGSSRLISPGRSFFVKLITSW